MREFLYMIYNIVQDKIRHTKWKDLSFRSKLLIILIIAFISIDIAEWFFTDEYKTYMTLFYINLAISILILHLVSFRRPRFK